MCHHERCNRHCMRPHPALAGTRWFEKFEGELKRHATTVEVVPDNETFRFGPGAVKKSSRAIIFPVAVGQTVFLLGASLLDEEVSLLISMGVLKQLGSVIDEAKKRSAFQTFQNVKVPREVVAGHLTMDLQPKHASTLQTQLTPQMWEHARQGQEATILRPSSEKKNLTTTPRCTGNRSVMKMMFR